MSYHVAFLTEGTPEPIEGPHVASTRGYCDFGGFVERRPKDWPFAASLVSRGFIEETHGGEIEGLEQDLKFIEAAARDTVPDVASVARHLLNAMYDAPAGTFSVMIVDGEGNEDAEADPPDGDTYGP